MSARVRPVTQRRQSEDFTRETKLVVLNYMGLVPASCPATADAHLDGVRVSVSPNDEEDLPLRSHSALPYADSDLQPVPEHPSEESCSQLQNGTSDAGICDITPYVGVDSIPGSVPGVTSVRENGPSDESSTEEISHSKLSRHQTDSAADEHVARSSAHSSHQSHSALAPPPVSAAGSRTPSPCAGGGAALLDRQSSSRSTTSSRSRGSASRNSAINVQVADLEKLVKTHVLPPLVIPLRREISFEMGALGGEIGDDYTADEENAELSPETEVANMLRTIGDSANDELDELLSEAVAAILPGQATNQDVTYDTLSTAATRMIDNVNPGWPQVAMILMLSQRLAFSMLSHNHKIGDLVNYTTQFIEDHVADFIISNGGWESILDMQLSDLLEEETRLSIDDNDEQGSHSSVPTQGHRHTDNADKQRDNSDCPRELVPDCHNVPLYSRSVSNIQSDTEPADHLGRSVEHSSTSDKVGDDSDNVFAYLALCGVIVVVASAVYSQIKNGKQ